MKTVIQKGEWRFPVENNFVRDNKISMEARLLYIIIKGYIGPQCAQPFPSLGTLAHHCGRHRESVQKYLIELEIDGYIQRQHAKVAGKFVSTRYVLFENGNRLNENRRGKKPLRKLPTTETSSTKIGNHSKGVSMEAVAPRRPACGHDHTTETEGKRRVELRRCFKPAVRQARKMARDAASIRSAIESGCDDDASIIRERDDRLRT